MTNELKEKKEPTLDLKISGINDITRAEEGYLHVGVCWSIHRGYFDYIPSYMAMAVGAISNTRSLWRVHNSLLDRGMITEKVVGRKRQITINLDVIDILYQKSQYEKSQNVTHRRPSTKKNVTHRRPFNEKSVTHRRPSNEKRSPTGDLSHHSQETFSSKMSLTGVGHISNDIKMEKNLAPKGVAPPPKIIPQTSPPPIPISLTEIMEKEDRKQKALDGEMVEARTSSIDPNFDSSITENNIMVLNAFKSKLSAGRRIHDDGRMVGATKALVKNFGVNAVLERIRFCEKYNHIPMMASVYNPMDLLEKWQKLEDNIKRMMLEAQAKNPFAPPVDKIN